MPDNPEACGAKGTHEAVGVWPAVEADAEAVTLQDAEYLGKSWLEPCVVIVVWYGSPIPRLVAGDVGRVGQDEVDAASR